MNRPPDRRNLADLTAGVDQLAALRCHRFRHIDIPVPADHHLLWFDVFPLAGALALVRHDSPAWICRWRLDGRQAVITDWRAFWYSHHQDMADLPLATICWLADRYLVSWAAPSGGHFWRRCLREARSRGLLVRSGVIGPP
ncbi:hypothetical protein ACK3Z8_11875 [Aeromonas caviae]